MKNWRGSCPPLQARPSQCLQVRRSLVGSVHLAGSPTYPLGVCACHPQHATALWCRSKRGPTSRQHHLLRAVRCPRGLQGGEQPHDGSSGRGQEGRRRKKPLSRPRLLAGARAVVSPVPQGLSPLLYVLVPSCSSPDLLFSQAALIFFVIIALFPSPGPLLLRALAAAPLAGVLLGCA